MKSIGQVLESKEMADFQRNRSDVLNAEERATSARKCLQLLTENPRVPKERWKVADLNFYNRELGFANSQIYAPSDRVLQWLRDMVSRYVT
jgi:hypothetical protein